MSENSDHKLDTNAQEHPPAAAITEDLGWDSPQRTPAAGRSGAGEEESTVLRLPARQRSARGHRGAGAPGARNERALAGRGGGPSWGAAILAVMLAACISAAVTLAITSPSLHGARPAKPSARLATPPATRHPARQYQPRPTGSAHAASAKRMLTHTTSERSAPVLPPVPASAPASGPPVQPAPAPAQRAAGEEEASGGPFSP
jgi:hypothetical protein